ncbi:unnamed protein product [Vitrella brassicaformis CCMP3155]|uniref:4-alpha-glucanotransferase n=2 Tax=Vitrella brassicaformis TaxID=1169539 RepID=A0A0G4EH70_VITBC|nr:unnamed protein product [Vitrella brassicaformis CCMP3155]|eukprot:CEL95313.1 unnamed protein product [Vitrella brassicaformis CCMP3155]
MPQETPLPRAAGVVLHPTALPSRYGVGDMGPPAYEFVDFLVKSGLKYWQVLPLGPTDAVMGHSPYMTLSTFAGNPLLISPTKLAEAGYLNHSDLTPLPPAGPGKDATHIDFDAAVPHKMKLFRKSFEHFKGQGGLSSRRFVDFSKAQGSWLDTFALFMALRDVYPGQTWNEWPRELRLRTTSALKEAAATHSDSVNFHKYLQFMFFEQWGALKRYANSKGVSIFGDVSIYVNGDSSDVWGSPEEFDLHPETREPLGMSGVPPDYFSATGQLWGHPVYNWAEAERNGFKWWVDRFRTTMELVDLIRIDHFRGFEAFWRVDAQHAKKHQNAIEGEWVKAPGWALFETIATQLGWKEPGRACEPFELPVCAEDLGLITPEVEALRDHFGFPGMKVLQFAWGGDSSNIHLPHNVADNSVVYPGTHDNDTALGWWQRASDKDKQHVAEYTGLGSPASVSEPSWLLIRMAFASRGRLALAPLQDFLSLDNTARFNLPGSFIAENWSWQMPSTHCLTSALAQRIRRLTELYGREQPVAAQPPPPAKSEQQASAAGVAETRKVGGRRDA